MPEKNPENRSLEGSGHAESAPCRVRLTRFRRYVAEESAAGCYAFGVIDTNPSIHRPLTYTRFEMKSAYEMALERLEAKGIERPREDSLTDETREQISEVRRQADAKLAEVEILYQDEKKTGFDAQADQEYLIDRRRIEEGRDRKIEKLRQG